MTKKFTPSLWDLEHLLESTGYSEAAQCVDFVEQQVIQFDDMENTEFEARFVPQIRVSFLMALISRMEYHLRKVCDVMAEMRNLTVRHSDLKGPNGFDSCVRYLEKVLQVQMPEILAEVKSIVDLRNAWVHNGGYVDRLPTRLGAAKAHVRKGTDGQIVLDEYFLGHAAQLCHTFVDAVVNILNQQNAKWAAQKSPHRNKKL